MQWLILFGSMTLMFFSAALVAYFERRIYQGDPSALILAVGFAMLGGMCLAVFVNITGELI